MMRAPVTCTAIALGLVTLAGCDRFPFHPRDGMVTLPTRGSWVSSESPPSAPPPAGCVLHIETAQDGEATVLGPFTGTGETCVTDAQPSMDTPDIWDQAPAPPYLVAKFDSHMTWVTASGDELHVAASGADFVQSQANGATAVSGVLSIEGGTGRFEGASGELSVSGGRGPGEPGDEISFEGDVTVERGR
ncbi:MAG: hypothetical protein PVJ80_18065 [Gemmatimonadota bacterium]|jgi:hypothetical protein